jgi:hypothetical protein
MLDQSAALAEPESADFVVSGDFADLASGALVSTALASGALVSDDPLLFEPAVLVESLEMESVLDLPA